MQRLMESRQMTERESGKLIDVQMSLDQKAALANYVVENSGNFQDLKSQVIFILLLDIEMNNLPFLLDNFFNK